MKLFRFFLILFVIIVIPTIATILFMYFAKGISINILIAGIIIFVFILALYTKFLNRKAKIFSIILGLIMLLPVSLAQYFLQQKNTTINPGISTQKFNIEHTKMPLTLIGIDENIFKPQETNYKSFDRLTNEQCKTWDSSITQLESFPMFSKNSYQSEEFINNHPHSLFEKIYHIHKLQQKQNYIIYKNINPRNTKSKQDIINQLDKSDKQEYYSHQKEIEDYFQQIQEKQNGDFHKEKMAIFTPDFLDQYKKFLVLMKENINNNAGKIICHENFYESLAFSRVRILINYIILSSVYKNQIYLQESIDILSEFLEFQKEKYSKRNNIQATNSLIYATLTIGMYKESYNIIEFLQIISLENINLSRFINTLKQFDVKKEYKLALQHNYWGSKSIIENFTKNPDHTVDFGIKKEFLHLFDTTETLQLLQNMYATLLYDADNTLPETPYSKHFQHEGETFHSFLYKKLNISEKDDESFLSRSIQPSTTPNYSGRILFLTLFPDNIPGIQHRFAEFELQQSDIGDLKFQNKN